MLLHLFLIIFLITSHNLIILRFKLLDLFLRLTTLAFQLSDRLYHSILVTSRLQCLSHTEGDRTFIQGLVVRQKHLVLVTDTYEQETALGTVNCDLSDQFVKNLFEKIFAHLADTMLSSVLLVESVLQLLLQVYNVYLCRRLW